MAKRMGGGVAKGSGRGGAGDGAQPPGDGDATDEDPPAMAAGLDGRGSAWERMLEALGRAEEDGGADALRASIGERLRSRRGGKPRSR